jgi:hypothetical protein
MHIKYRYDRERNILYERGVDEVSYGDFRSYYRELSDLPLKPGFKNLADYRDITIKLSSEDIWRVKKIADDLVRRCGGSKLAVVVDSDFSYGMARMFTMTSDLPGFEIGVFKNTREACAWLEIEEPRGDIA